MITIKKSLHLNKSSQLPTKSTIKLVKYMEYQNLIIKFNTHHYLHDCTVPVNIWNTVNTWCFIFTSNQLNFGQEKGKGRSWKHFNPLSSVITYAHSCSCKRDKCSTCATGMWYVSQFQFQIKHKAHSLQRNFTLSFVNHCAIGTVNFHDLMRSKVSTLINKLQGVGS